MTHAKLGSFLDDLRRLVGPPPSSASDHCLLARFLASQDQAAFAALLGRHGPMVFAVCRRLLGRVQDAEDVVQAVFLLLARKAATIRKHTSLNCWLHGVARRLSIGLARRQVNRLEREKNAARIRGQAEGQRGSTEILEWLDTSLQELPEKHRAALILCYLEGQSQPEAAKQLGCPLGTVRSRLARGRSLLQKKLAARGLALSAAAVAAELTAGTSPAALPIRLFGATLQAAVQYASGKALSGLVSASVVLLVKSGLKSIALTKMAWICAGILSLGLLAGGAGLAAKSSLAGADEPPRPRQEIQAKASEPEVEKPRADLLGDPLPPHALFRLGTLRLRHGDSVRKLSFSPDGKTLLSADWHGVHIWDAATGRHLRRFGDPRGRQFQSMAASADNRLVALTMSEGDIEIWDADTGRRLRQFRAGRFPHVLFSPDSNILAVLELGLVDRKEVQSLRLVDAHTGAELHRLSGHQDRIHSVVFSKDGKTLVTSSDDKSIRFWDVSTGKQVRQLVHPTSVGLIALSPDGATLATVATKKSESTMQGGGIATMWTAADEVVLWDVATGKETHHLKGRKNGAKDMPFYGSLNFIMFTPDSKTLVSSVWTTTYWWDVATGKEIIEGNLPVDNLMNMAYSSDGSKLATSWHQTIQLWSVVTGKRLDVGSGHQESVSAVAVAPDGRTFATGGGDKTIRLWDAASGREIHKLAGLDSHISSLAFVPGGRTLISNGLDKSEARVSFWDMATGKEIRRFAGIGPTLSPDGKLLVTQTTDGFSCVLDVAGGQEIRKLARTRSVARAFSADGRQLFSYDDDKKVHIWEVATGKELRNFEGHHFRDSLDRIYCVAFSPDGKLVAFGGQDNAVAVYDTATGKQDKLLPGRSYSLSRLAFSPDSRVLAAGDWTGGTVHLWEMATGQEFQQLAGHTGRMLSITFSPDGRLLLTGSEDTTALAWDLIDTRIGPKARPLTAKELEAAWADLSAADAMRGQKAVRALLAVPNQAGTLLTRELRPPSPPDAKQLARLIVDLDSELFKTREEAMRALEELGDVAAPAVRQALAGSPTLEMKRRLEGLLDKFATSQRLRTLRVVQALEQLATQPARELLARLATGVPEALLTQEALAAVERLAKLRAAR